MMASIHEAQLLLASGRAGRAQASELYHLSNDEPTTRPPGTSLARQMFMFLLLPKIARRSGPTGRRALADPFLAFSARRRRPAI